MNGRGPDCVPLNLGRKRDEVLDPLRMHKLGYLLKAKLYIAAGIKMDYMCALCGLLDIMLDFISDPKLLKKLL